MGCGQSKEEKPAKEPAASTEAPKETAAPASATTMAFFDNVETAPPNAIFKLVDMYNEDTFENKVNLSVGAYKDEEGKPWVLPVVKKAEKILLDQLNAGEINHEYLPIGGLPSFVTAAQRFALGDDHAAIAAGRVDGIQTLSGTGALRTAGEFVHDFLECKDIYISKPTWGNHKTIFARCHLTVKEYRYYKPETRGLDFEAMVEDMKAAAPGSTFVLHACAHNPTGVDCNLEQWKEIADICKAGKLFCIFDSAYQGFASGDPAFDSASMRHFASEGIPFLICQSFSKNLGLYNERTGCVQVVANDPKSAQAVASQLKILVRANWSNPPAHGARIASTVLNSPELKAEWYGNLKSMSGRIALMRSKLKAALVAKGTAGTWDHIVDQIGMFSFTGLTPEQVEHLITKYHIYLLKNGRINMCGLNEHNVQYIADAIHDAVTNVTAKL